MQRRPTRIIISTRFARRTHHPTHDLILVNLRQVKVSTTTCHGYDVFGSGDLPALLNKTSHELHVEEVRVRLLTRTSSTCTQRCGNDQKLSRFRHKLCVASGLEGKAAAQRWLLCARIRQQRSDVVCWPCYGASPEKQHLLVRGPSCQAGIPLDGTCGLPCAPSSDSCRAGR